MTKRKLSILLMLSPALIILIGVLDLSIYIIPDFLFDTYLILLFIGSPILVGIGLILLILSKEKGKPRLTSKVSKKRKIVGKVILFAVICPSIFFFLYILFFQQIKLGIKNKLCPTPPSSTQTEVIQPTLLGSYEIEGDEYIWEWDMNDYGYFYLEKYIDTPRQYIFGDTVEVKRSWDLKNGYKLEVYCEEIDISTVDIDNPYRCSVYYDGKLIRNDIRHEAYCFYEGGNNCVYNIGIVVYSNAYSESDTEYLITTKYITGFFSDISVYVLENGEYRPLPFKYRDGEEYLSELSYMVSSNTF